jgi:uncharacterized membrane protein
MSTTHIHLLLNHFPILGTFIGCLFLAWGIFKKNNSLKNAAAVLLTFISLTAVPVYLTGEPAEEAIEKLPGISETMAELHEEAANLAIWLMAATGVVSIAVLLLNWLKRASAGAYIMALVLSVSCFAAMARTGYYGGKIRHSEIRTETVNAKQPGDQTQENAAETKQDED